MLVPDTVGYGNAFNGDRPLSAGALAFAPDGTLFLGDSKAGAIWAYPSRATGKVADVAPFLFADIDQRMGKILGVEPRRLVYNGMAVHPLTREPHISLGVKNAGKISPAVVRVSLDGAIALVDLTADDATVQTLSNIPDPDKTFRSRAGEWPVPSETYYEEKARTPMRAMAIVDIKFHNGELFVSGVSNQEFCSVLRRVPYPFKGVSRETHLEIFHVAHGIYETRAPIRTMQFATLNGEDTLIAAYACSPIVTIPVSQLADGATVIGKTIGDMGNGQPICMVAYRDAGEDRLLITNVGRGPVVLPLSNLEGAPAFTAANAPHRDMLLDLSPHMPAGPVGKQVMFVGSSLRVDLISDRFFVSLTREADTGGLTLETVPVGPLPVRLEKVWVEFDFPGGQYVPPDAR
jgi:hypothetical protein